MSTRAPQRGPQEGDMLGEQPESTFGQIGRKDAAAAEKEVSSIVGNCLILVAPNPCRTDDAMGSLCSTHPTTVLTKEPRHPTT